MSKNGFEHLELLFSEYLLQVQGFREVDRSSIYYLKYFAHSHLNTTAHDYLGPQKSRDNYW